MSEWQLRRFWSTVTYEAVADGGWVVRLDERTLHTPAKAPLILPTPALAAAIAAEWAAQDGLVEPARMPLTRMANAAVDKVVSHQAAVAAQVATYGETDLLCYRATGPAALVAQQAAAWDPMLEWAAQALVAPLQITTGVMARPQPPETIARLTAEVARLDPFQLAAIHELVAITGSLILGLAICHEHINADTAWSAATVDEAWQAAHWGADPEAAAVAAERKNMLLAAAQFLRACKPAPMVLANTVSVPGADP